MAKSLSSAVRLGLSPCTILQQLCDFGQVRSLLEVVLALIILRLDEISHAKGLSICLVDRQWSISISFITKNISLKSLTSFINLRSLSFFFSQRLDFLIYKCN